MESITQDMMYKQSLMEYSLKHGVSKASRKYDRARSYIYFWLARYDGTIQSLQPQSKRPKHHPNEHTEAGLKLIRDMRCRNPDLGMIELWHRFRQRGYTRRPESLHRVMKRLGMFKQKKANKRYPPEFKEYVIKTMREEGQSYRETERRFELPRGRAADWERIYLEEGAEGFQIERRGRRSTGRPRKLPKAVEEDLLAEGQRLRTENEYLKKLHALVLEDERRQHKNAGSSGTKAAT